MNNDRVRLGKLIAKTLKASLHMHFSGIVGLVHKVNSFVYAVTFCAYAYVSSTAHMLFFNVLMAQGLFRTVSQ